MPEVPLFHRKPTSSEKGITMRDERLSDDFAEYLRHVKEASAAGPTTDEQEANAAGPTRFVDIKVYDLHPGEQAPLPSIEGTLAAEAAPDQQQDAPQPDEPEPGDQDKKTTPMTLRWNAPVPFLVVGAIGTALFVLIGAGVWYLLPLLAPTATVTIVPISRAVTATGTLTVTTGPANAAQHEIPGRVLGTITMSQAERVPTTGTGHQDAQAASGTITFYNAAPYVQTVSAGTLLTGADGVQVVTDGEAVIPAAVPPTEGQVTVSAHAVLPGPAGNIAAHDIYGQCCRLNVFAANSAFSGGQDARTYPEVTAHDISAAATNLEKQLTRSMQAAFQPQVRSDETLITPLPCTPLVSPDHQAGTEATEVQITASLLCTGEVYRTSAFEAQMTQLVTHAALPLGPGYEPTGTIQASVTATTYRPHGAVTLVVKGAGTWTYQINETERATMAERIAGKSKAQATALLLTMPGVQSAAIDEQRSDQLPGDTSRIQLVIVTY
jgi:hypothetical protein